MPFRQQTTDSTPFNTVVEAVEAIARGEVIIVVDAEDRENEGDFVCAAEKATVENINFMLSGRGQLCCAGASRSRSTAGAGPGRGPE